MLLHMRTSVNKYGLDHLKKKSSQLRPNMNRIHRTTLSITTRKPQNVLFLSAMLPAVCLNAGSSLSSRSHSACKRSVSGHLPAFCSRLIAELLTLSIAPCMTLKVRGQECFHTFSVDLLQTMEGKTKKKKKEQSTLFILHGFLLALSV